MAVYERTYHPYTGPVTPPRTRFLILPSYAYQEIFKSKFFISFLVLCFVWPLILAVTIYAAYNLTFIKNFIGANAQPGAVFDFKFDNRFFFYAFLTPQSALAFFMAFIVGPALISSDTQNNGLPLYLCRPFSRWDYILGKASILVILLSAITWVPGLLLFFLHAHLAGWSWAREHWYVATGLFLGSWVGILLLCLISLALSAYVKWKPIARLMMFFVFIVASGLGTAINVMLRTSWGSLIDLWALLHVIRASMFRIRPVIDIPPVAAWVSMLAICAFFLVLLARKIKAYEVVR